MRTRILLGSAVVALATTLGPAPGALAADAVFGGSTSGAEPIALTANKSAKKLRSAVIAWESKCGDGQNLSLGTALTPSKASPGFTPGSHDLLMSRNGKRRFAGKQLIGLGLGDSTAAIEVSLEGRLGAKSAAGTLSAKVTIFENATGNQQQTCTTGRLRWKATRAPGRVYAGKTSQDEPVVARLDAKRKRITDLLVSWESSSCQPDGFIHFGERLHNFPLASTGRFEDSWEDTEKGSDGSTTRVTYALGGRVARRAARGTLRVGVANTDAAGAPAWSCDSGGVTWKATTG
jgi:hypothetical protein